MLSEQFPFSILSMCGWTLCKDSGHGTKQLSRQHQPHSVLLQQWDNPCSARPRLKEFGLLATRASW